VIKLQNREYEQLIRDMIYLLTAIGLSPGGSITVHIYTQTVYRTTQLTTSCEECGPCPVFANFTLGFTLQLRKKHGKTSVRVQYTYYSDCTGAALWEQYILTTHLKKQHYHLARTSKKNIHLVSPFLKIPQGI